MTKKKYIIGRYLGLFEDGIKDQNKKSIKNYKKTNTSGQKLNFASVTKRQVEAKISHFVKIYANYCKKNIYIYINIYVYEKYLQNVFVVTRVDGDRPCKEDQNSLVCLSIITGIRSFSCFSNWWKFFFIKNIFNEFTPCLLQSYNCLDLVVSPFSSLLSSDVMGLFTPPDSGKSTSLSEISASLSSLANTNIAVNTHCNFYSYLKQQSYFNIFLYGTPMYFICWQRACCYQMEVVLKNKARKDF